MEELKKKPQVNIIYLVLLVIFTLAGFFAGSYYTEKKLSRITEPVTIIEDLPAERHLNNLRLLTGWEDPLTMLRDDLLSRPEIIPVAPVVGGTMGFYDRDGIRLLNDKWALAWFEDGHIGGYLLLEFEIKEEKIDWKVLSSYLE
jgi:hypothetical protein